ncbi:MAG: site-2 protease family protein [Gemmatimonadetes bacterium]|nr:site-2 protease family protein [Gemmatimonadota bacterium]
MEQLLIALPVLIFSVVLHEVAHGYAARAQGDPTAAMLGRLTLNPIPHLDPIGSLLVPGILALSGAPVLGWARPVPVNSRNFRNYRRGDIIVSLAGVAVNLVLAIICAMLLAVLSWLVVAAPGYMAAWQMVGMMLHYGVLINLILLVFNLLPIPPLDGSHVFYHLLPPRLGAQYRQLTPYGMFILFGLLFLTRFSFIAAPVYAMRSVLLSLTSVLAAG